MGVTEMKVTMTTSNHVTNGAILLSQEELGKGTQGTVYRVSFNGRNYALKLYHQSVLDNDTVRSRLKQLVNMQALAIPFAGL